MSLGRSHGPLRVRVQRAIVLILLVGSAVSIADAQTRGPVQRPQLPLEVLPDSLAICRLAPDAEVPAWASTPTRFITISRTLEELSITAVQKTVPPEVRCERGYRALQVRGPLPLNLIGVLAAIAEPLAEAGLSIFAISTFDTDYILVKSQDLDAAVATLEQAGHQVSR